MMGLTKEIEGRFFKIGFITYFILRFAKSAKRLCAPPLLTMFPVSSTAALEMVLAEHELDDSAAAVRQPTTSPPLATSRRDDLSSVPASSHASSHLHAPHRAAKSSLLVAYVERAKHTCARSSLHLLHSHHTPSYSLFFLCPHASHTTHQPLLSSHAQFTHTHTHTHTHY